jgi:DNA-binding NarL/FixJ family response regulator
METKKRILIVDDEAQFCDGLCTALEAQSYVVAVATSRTQAQEMAHSEKPDGVIVGTITPRGEAYLLHRWFRQTHPFQDVPMIIIDAAPEHKMVKGWSRSEGLRIEAQDYFTKPVDPQGLVPLIAKMVDLETKRIRVLVVDDHAIVRDGIRALLGVQRDIQVVGEAVDGADAVSKARQLSPDVVLMDIVMPGMNGLEATQQICKECERTKVLMLSQYDDEANVAASSQVGAYDFIPKGSASTQLLSAIRSMT